MLTPLSPKEMKKIMHLAGPDDVGYANAVLRPVPIQAVTMHDGFWRSRMDGNRKGIMTFLEWLERDNQTSPFRAFARFARTGDGSGIKAGLETLQQNRQRHPWRANTQTWLEACALVLQSDNDLVIRRLLDEFVIGVVAAHKDNEFLKVYYGNDYEHSYGLATPGHLFYAAIAHRRATGSTEFLKCAMLVADDIIAKFQGNGNFANHAGIEMALVELYRETGNETYLHGARHFLEHWLRQRPVIGGGSNLFNEEPWEGANMWCARHVVRQPYLCAAGADYLAETGDMAFRSQSEAIWNDMTSGKIQLSGAIATSRINVGAEQIVEQSYDLSAGVVALRHGGRHDTRGIDADENEDADVAASREHPVHQLGFETCEAVGTLYWSWRMLLATGEPKYADWLERVLYNNFLAHVSLDGTAFDYICGLASDGDDPPRTAAAHPMTSCCPGNVLRTIASIPGFLFSVSGNGLWIHQYAASRLDWQLPDGTPVQVTQKTQYPWNGAVAIEVDPELPTDFDLNLRIPGWCRNVVVKVNGIEADVPATGGSYFCLTRSWIKGDIVTLDFAMPILSVTADPRVTALMGKTALMRGPLVYCFEGLDNPDNNVTGIVLRDGIEVQLFDHTASANELYQPCGEASGFDAVWEKDLLNGVMVLRHRSSNDNGVMAIPYFAFRNRATAPMRVWVDLKTTTEPNRGCTADE